MFTDEEAQREVRVTSRHYRLGQTTSAHGGRPTITADRNQPRRARGWWGIATLLLATGALLAAGRAAITMVYLGVAYRDQLNPITRPASYYVYIDGGRGPFETASIVLALGVFGLLIGMAGAGVRMAGRPTVLFGIWACCMLLAAIFPTDDSPAIETVAGLIHQFAGVGILALLSFAGLAAAPRLAESPAWRPVVGIVRLLSIGAASLATAYVMTRMVQFDPELLGLVGGVDIGGILQRLVFGFDIGVIAALAVHLVRVSWNALRSWGDTQTAPRACPASQGPRAS
jgi:hypothetical protein